MGHTRLGSIPKSRAWRAVVDAVVGGGAASVATAPEGVAHVAQLALQAAQGGLERATRDEGLRYTFYLLTQLALASRTSEWQDRLNALGVNVDEDATSFELATAFQGRIDDHLSRRRYSTDVAEIAQRSAGEALSELLGAHTQSLFGESGEELRLALRRYSTKNGFAELGQAFFGKFLSHYLNFFLSRVTATYVGRSAFQDIGDISRFNAVLDHHCFQSARIVKDFCGEWYSKTEFQRGIDLEAASGFVAVAVKKLQAELRQQEGQQ